MAVLDGRRPSAVAAVPGPSALPGPAVLRALSAACGLDLRSFRAEHAARTIARAVGRGPFRDAPALAAAMREDPTLRARFRRALAVSTTGMFRDPQQFALIDRLLEDPVRRSTGLRAWSVGASDGSELCSLALLLERRGLVDGAVLLGSDLLLENVELAERRARERLAGPALRAVRFERRDVVHGRASGHWDVVLCRNVLIHLAPGAREALLDHAVAALGPGGLLVLGRAERLPRDARRGLVDAGAHAYRRVA